MDCIFCVLIGYLIGTVNSSYIFAAIHGFDIRERGSKNAGASNAVIVLGKAIGVICALLDIGKACFAIWLASKLFPQCPYMFPLTGVACILGHIFPFYMKFKGGKGLASFGGVILMFDWRVFLILLAVEIVIALVTDYICFVPITASIAFPIIYAFMRKDVVGVLLFLITTFVMLFKHIENLKRIRNGTEVHISFLWNRNKEIERVKKNAND